MVKGSGRRKLRRDTRVFISAVSAELSTVRKLIKTALEDNDYHAVEQDNLRLDYRSVTDKLRNVITSCDAVIHIVGHNYGAEPPTSTRPADAPRRSYTQLEYEIAKELEKPVYVFVTGVGFPADSAVEEDAEKRRLQDEYRAQLTNSGIDYCRANSRDDVDRTVRTLQFRVAVLEDELTQVDEKVTSIGRKVIAVVVASTFLILMLGLGYIALQPRTGEPELIKRQQPSDEQNRISRQVDSIVAKLDELDNGWRDLQSKLIEFRRTNEDPRAGLSGDLERENKQLRVSVRATREVIETFKQEQGSLTTELEARTLMLDRAEKMLDNPLDFIWEEVPANAAVPMRVVNPAQTATLAGHTGKVLSIVFSPDGKLAATGSEDKTIKLWNTSDWSMRCTLRGYNSSVQCVVFSHDSRLLAWGGDGFDKSSVRVWNIPQRRDEATLHLQFTNWPSRVYSLAFSPDNHALAAGSSGPARVWDLVDKGNERSLSWQTTFPSYNYAVSFSPDGALLAGGCHGGDMSPQIAESVRLWNWRDNKLREQFIGGNDPFLGLSHSDVRGVVAFNRDGTKLVRVTKGSDRDRPGPNLFRRRSKGNLTVWNLDQGNKKTSYEVPGGNAFSLAILPDNEITLAVVRGPEDRGFSTFGLDGNERQDALNLWNTDQRKHWTFATGHEQSVVAVALAPDATRVATAGSEDNLVMIWDVRAIIERSKVGTD